MYTTMSNFPYLPHYLLPTSMIIISFVNFFDLSILTFQCSTISCQKWVFRGISWQQCCHCYPFCAALLGNIQFAIKHTQEKHYSFSKLFLNYLHPNMIINNLIFIKIDQSIILLIRRFDHCLKHD